jgi:hypothetical protein
MLIVDALLPTTNPGAVALCEIQLSSSGFSNQDVDDRREMLKVQRMLSHNRYGEWLFNRHQMPPVGANLLAMVDQSTLS